MKAVRSKIDIGRLRAAAAGPGTDPRVWVSYAVVTDVGYDAKFGILADFKAMPNGEENTAYVGMTYWGNGFGEWCPVEVNDVVKLDIPYGDPDSTPIITHRIPQPPFLPSPFFKSDTADDQPTEDRVLVIKPGQKYRLYVTKGGEVDIFAGDDQSTFLKVKDGEILVGDDNAAPVIPSNWASDPSSGLIEVLGKLASALTTAGVTNTLASDLTMLPTAATTKGKIT